MSSEKTAMRLSLADEAERLGASLDPLRRSLLSVVMENSADALRKLRDKKRVRNWLAKHPERIPQYGRRYYAKNILEITKKRNLPEARLRKSVSSKKYQQTPDYKLRRAADYRRNPEPIRVKVRLAGRTPEGRKRASQYQRIRRKKPQIHFLNWLRGSINRDLRRQSAKKGGRTETLIGCSFDELRKHLESQFVNGMSWETRSAIDIDHIVPVSAFDLTDSEEQLCAFNYRNLRPLDRLENKRKSSTVPNPLPYWLPSHIASRILARI